MDNIESINKYYYIHVMLFLVSVEVLIAFSGLGYINNDLNVALLYVPVLAGAYFFGAKVGLFMGAVFGITTMWKASVAEVNYLNSIFSPVLSGNVTGTIVIALVVRMLFGLMAGLMFSYIKCFKFNEYIKVIFVIFFSQVIYIVLLLVAMDHFFPAEDLYDAGVFNFLFSTRELILLGISSVLMCLIIYVTKTKTFKEVFRVIIESRHSVYTKRFSLEALVFAVIMVIVMLGLMFHLQYRFVSMTDTLSSGILDSVRSSLINIYLQFLAGIISVSYILGFLLSVYRAYTIYEINHSDRDMMTGLYGKNLAFEFGKDIVSNKKRFPNAYFMIIDIDRFKQINDTHGHLAGDSVIIDFARFLEINFSNLGMVCRFGGDEFCVFITKECTRYDIEKAIQKFISSISNIYLGDSKFRVTCSIGVVEFGESKNFNEVYSQADKALYSVKNSGRNNYCFYSDM